MSSPDPLSLAEARRLAPHTDTILLRAELYDTERVIHMNRTALPDGEPNVHSSESQTASGSFRNCQHGDPGPTDSHQANAR